MKAMEMCDCNGKISDKYPYRIFFERKEIMNNKQGIILFKSVFVAYLIVCLAAIMSILCVGCNVRQSTGAGMSVIRAHTEAELKSKRRRTPAVRRQQRRQQLRQQLDSQLAALRPEMAKLKGKHISQLIQVHGPVSEITRDGKGGSIYMWRMKDLKDAEIWSEIWVELFFYTDGEGIVYHTLVRGGVY